MNKVAFEVELLHEPDASSQPVVELSLPATPWKLSDAMDALRMHQDEKAGMIVDILDYHGYDFLDDHLASHENLYALNVLAQKLAEWNDAQRELFRGAVSLEKLGEDHSLPTLIDLAHSMNTAYNVAPGAVNDEQLGRFYVDGGFVPETDDLTDQQCELLDYAKIGRKMREGENGIFTSVGYVVKTSEIESIYRALDLKPARPDYTVLLELEAGDRTTLLKLPASRPDLEAALTRLGQENWNDVTYTCEDCRVPALKEAISATKVISVADNAARVLNGLTDADALKYKALLAARGFDSLADALDVAETLEQYNLVPEYASYEDIALDELSVTLAPQDAETLIPYVDLQRYGEAVMKKYNQVFTDYGVIERKDGQPIQAMAEQEQPAMGGMEMM